MASPAGPIYASTLHRRDRAWGGRRRGLRLRAALAGGTLLSVGAMVLAHFG